MRGWMRFISTAPEFTWSGTGFILGSATMAGLGFGLIESARRSGRNRAWRLAGLLSVGVFGGAGLGCERVDLRRSRKRRSVGVLGAVPKLVVQERQAAHWRACCLPTTGGIFTSPRTGEVEMPPVGEDGAVTRASLDRQPSEIAAMFDAVAARYDITNDVLSLGQDRRWRRALEEAVVPRPGERVLDLAAGTGTSSEPFAAAGAFVVPCDFSPGMLRVGKRLRPDLPFVAGDALQQPFADESFDAVTISFGLRNLNDVEAGLREMLRVTRPGGRLVVCEFSHPTWAPFRTVYVEYLMRALPPLARCVSSSPDAYVYLAESIRAWPDQRGLAERIAGAGWSDVRWRDLSGGIVALHYAEHPAS